MVVSIPEKYCQEDFVQLAINPKLGTLLFNVEEIILLKYGNCIFDQYQNYKMREQLSISSESIQKEGYFTEFFSYNKLYLSFTNNGEGIQFLKHYAIKEQEKSYIISESLPLLERNGRASSIMNREEVEKYFNPLEYDALYIMDVNGIIICAYNKKDGFAIKQTIIPSEEQIIKKELDKRTFTNKASCMISENYTNWQKSFKEKGIEEIKKLKLFGGLFGNCDLLVTIKNGKLNVKWFELYFLEQDKFEFSYSDIPVLEPTREDILKEIEARNIEEIEEPSTLKRILI